MQFINDVDSSKLFSLNNLTLAAFKLSIKISSWNAFKQNWVKNIELVGIWPIVSAYRLSKNRAQKYKQKESLINVLTSAKSVTLSYLLATNSMNIDSNRSARRCTNFLWNKNKIEENDSGYTNFVLTARLRTIQSETWSSGPSVLILFYFSKAKIVFFILVEQWLEFILNWSYNNFLNYRREGDLYYVSQR